MRHASVNLASMRDYMIWRLCTEEDSNVGLCIHFFVQISQTENKSAVSGKGN